VSSSVPARRSRCRSAASTWRWSSGPVNISG
jgi:hypothetical protein